MQTTDNYFILSQPSEVNAGAERLIWRLSFHRFRYKRVNRCSLEAVSPCCFESSFGCSFWWQQVSSRLCCLCLAWPSAPNVSGYTWEMAIKNACMPAQNWKRGVAWNFPGLGGESNHLSVCRRGSVTKGTAWAPSTVIAVIADRHFASPGTVSFAMISCFYCHLLPDLSYPLGEMTSHQLSTNVHHECSR